MRQQHDHDAAGRLVEQLRAGRPRCGEEEADALVRERPGILRQHVARDHPARRMGDEEDAPVVEHGAAGGRMRRAQILEPLLGGVVHAVEPGEQAGVVAGEHDRRAVEAPVLGDLPRPVVGRARQRPADPECLLQEAPAGEAARLGVLPLLEIVGGAAVDEDDDRVAVHAAIPPERAVLGEYSRSGLQRSAAAAAAAADAARMAAAASAASARAAVKRSSRRTPAGSARCRSRRRACRGRARSP